MTRSRSATVLALALLALLALPAAASADERFAPENGAISPQIATEGGRFVFVGSKEGGPTELFEGFGEDAVALGFRDAGNNSSIIDVHIGTDARRKPVLVFTYCAGSGSCDLFRYDFGTRRRSRLGISRRRCDELGGRMERGVLYFARRGSGRRCANGVFALRRGRPPRRLLATEPESWDVSRGVIAFERTGELHEVRVKRIGSRRSLRVASGAFSEDRKNERFAGVYFEDVSLDEGFVYWVHHDRGEHGYDEEESFDLDRAPAAGGATQRLSGERRSFSNLAGQANVAIDGGDIYYYSQPPGADGAIFKVGPGAPVFE